MAGELSEITRLDQLRALMARAGATRIVFKRLSPNDNSKNQIYLGGDYAALQLLPFSDVTADVSRTDSKRDRFKAKVRLEWLDDTGALFEAPNAQLILYPKYPEVRMSGFLQGARFRPSKYLGSRDEGRILILGITADDRIVGHVVGGDNPLKNQLDRFQLDDGAGVFVDLPLQEHIEDTRNLLLEHLRRICELGWVESMRLDRDGNRKPYTAQNGGGYTLEALLGVIPNGLNEPDFLGWEIKQHRAKLDNPLSGGRLTLMTPEPTGGIYRDQGAMSFLRRFGYGSSDPLRDRLDFAGVHAFQQRHDRSGLSLELDGFDQETGKIDNINGGIALRSEDGTEAAVWYYATLIEKWNRKHAKAAYIPADKQAGTPPHYRYGHVVGLGERSSITKFLRAIADRSIIYDPGINAKMASTQKPKVKKRSQFRISPRNLPALYDTFEIVDLLSNSENEPLSV